MNKTLILTLALIIFSAIPVIAGNPKVITLKDGSTINGNVVGIDNGHYVVVSPSFGEIKVKEDYILSITGPGAAALPPAAPQGALTTLQTTDPLNVDTYKEQMQVMQDKISKDPAAVSDIQSLLEDPEILAAFANPAFLEAAKTGNIQVLQNSPEMQRLMNNPKMQALVQKLKAQQ